MGSDVERFWADVEKADGCWLWMGYRTDVDGYGMFRPAGVKRAVRAHRYAWAVNFGEIHPGLVVMHLCDNPPCVNPDHLALGTPTANTLDANRKGRMNYDILRKPTGRRPSHTKLTPAAVILIRQSRGAVSQYALAQQFGVSRAAVRDAMSGTTWRTVVESDSPAKLEVAQ